MLGASGLSLSGFASLHVSISSEATTPSADPVISADCGVILALSALCYRRIRALLAQEGWLVSRKQVQRIRGDNGTEFIAGKIQRWLRENQIKTLYIEPGSPWQNGYIESFHSRFRDECLNREWLLNLREARVVIEDWRLHYNTERPHSRLGYLSPEDYIKHQIVSP